MQVFQQFGGLGGNAFAEHPQNLVFKKEGDPNGGYRCRKDAPAFLAAEESTVTILQSRIFFRETAAREFGNAALGLWRLPCLGSAGLLLGHAGGFAAPGEKAHPG